MFWIFFALIIVVYIIHNFLKDRDTMLQKQVDMHGGMSEKYGYLIKNLTIEPSAKVIKVTRSQVHIKAAGQSAITNYLIMENFNTVDIEWIGQTAVLGTHKHRWSFPHNYPQDKMLQEIGEYMQWKYEQIFGNGAIFLGTLEERLKEELKEATSILFEVFRKVDHRFRSSTINKNHTDAYFNYISLLVSGAIISYKLEGMGHEQYLKEQMKLESIIYQESFDFYYKYLEDKAIELPMQMTGGNLTFDGSSISKKIQEYKISIENFIETGEYNRYYEETNESEYEEGCESYLECWSYREENFPYSASKYDFVDKIYGTTFFDSQNGTIIKFGFLGYYDDASIVGTNIAEAFKHIKEIAEI